MNMKRAKVPPMYDESEETDLPTWSWAIPPPELKLEEKFYMWSGILCIVNEETAKKLEGVEDNSVIRDILFPVKRAV